MTQADIDSLVRYADEIGREVDETAARHVLTAKEILVTEPNDATALQVMREFADFLRTGIETNSFAGFLLPWVRTEEEKSMYGALKGAVKTMSGTNERG